MQNRIRQAQRQIGVLSQKAQQLSSFSEYLSFVPEIRRVEEELKLFQKKIVQFSAQIDRVKKAGTRNNVVRILNSVNRNFQRSKIEIETIKLQIRRLVKEVQKLNNHGQKFTQDQCSSLNRQVTSGLEKQKKSMEQLLQKVKESLKGNKSKQVLSLISGKVDERDAQALQQFKSQLRRVHLQFAGIQLLQYAFNPDKCQKKSVTRLIQSLSVFGPGEAAARQGVLKEVDLRLRRIENQTMREVAQGNSQNVKALKQLNELLLAQLPARSSNENLKF